jgi:hypothetical protein
MAIAERQKASTTASPFWLWASLESSVFLLLLSGSRHTACSWRLFFRRPAEKRFAVDLVSFVLVVFFSHHAPAVRSGASLTSHLCILLSFSVAPFGHWRIRSMPTCFKWDLRLVSIFSPVLLTCLSRTGLSQRATEPRQSRLLHWRLSVLQHVWDFPHGAFAPRVVAMDSTDGRQFWRRWGAVLVVIIFEVLWQWAQFFAYNTEPVNVAPLNNRKMNLHTPLLAPWRKITPLF